MNEESRRDPNGISKDPEHSSNFTFPLMGLQHAIGGRKAPARSQRWPSVA